MNELIEIMFHECHRDSICMHAAEWYLGWFFSFVVDDLINFNVCKFWRTELSLSHGDSPFMLLPDYILQNLAKQFITQIHESFINFAFVNLEKLNGTLKLFGGTITLWIENVILIWLINLIYALKCLIPIEFQVTAEMWFKSWDSSSTAAITLLLLIGIELIRFNQKQC